jgi:ubiquinone/menaquinone biosynthesis C-methylase UbiE
MDHSGYFADSFNRHVRWYEESITPLSIYNESYDALIARISPQAKLLDVGCGPANVSAYIKKRVPGIAVTGIDLAPAMLAKAKVHIPDGEFKVMDIREILKLNSKFDAIILGFCVPYLTDIETIALLKDTKEMLQQNGTVYMSFIECETTIPFSSENPVMRKHARSTAESYIKESGLKIIDAMSVIYNSETAKDEKHTIFLITRRE